MVTSIAYSIKQYNTSNPDVVFKYIAKELSGKFIDVRTMEIIGHLIITDQKMESAIMSYFNVHPFVELNVTGERTAV